MIRNYDWLSFVIAIDLSIVIDIDLSILIAINIRTRSQDLKNRSVTNDHRDIVITRRPY
jgi:hypothetical protein